MEYRKQLKQPEWMAKRLEILERDNFRCAACGAKYSTHDKWSAGFEDLPVGEIYKFGYQVFSNISNKIENIVYLSGSWVTKAVFVGECMRQPFSITDFRFSERIWQGGGKFYLVFYYPGEEHGIKYGQLNIHHKYYISGSLAWEYENDALITLCYSCHKEEHEREKIEIRSPVNSIAKTRFTKNCKKCEGTGYLPEYSHIDNGICYPCDGRGCL